MTSTPFRMLLCLAALAPVLSLTACSNKQVMPTTAEVDPLPADQYPSIVLAPRLKGWIVADKPSTTKNPTLKVVVRARSIAKEDTMHVQYRFTFLLPDGEPTDHADPSWRNHNMRPGTEEIFTAQAMDERVNDWRLEIR
jgi:hypothetical protein